ncbi:uncharacterized protein TM35_000181750 [Trypanosoma theileri]|uniref:Uncharacterized protein n=1 Tax=Trypanosoma theileri TaxID=67003 RepID=A0A1X0NUA0_9TRYP|nr:uncharacterized protein TM35_000181750 [Trypanosoma theileri]ORC88118.1 hypothetical protein TM35_000181750 [Trypanosoma theileri]
MTTVFVHLRRVVYLLVLLQCCTTVSQAQPARDGEFLVAKKAVDRSVRETKQSLEDVEACLYLWETQLPLCVGKCGEVKKLRGEIGILTGEIKSKIGGVGKVVPKEPLEEPLVGLVDKAKKMIPVAGEAARGCSDPVNKTKLREKMCGVFQQNLAPVVPLFLQHLQYYESEKSNAANQEEAEEFFKTSYALYYRANNVTEKIKNKTNDLRLCNTFGDHDWMDLRKEVGELATLIGNHDGTALGDKENAAWEALAGEKEKRRVVQRNRDREIRDADDVKVVNVKKGNESGFGVNDVARYFNRDNATLLVDRPRELQEDIKAFKKEFEVVKVEAERARILAEERARQQERERQLAAEKAKREREAAEREREKKEREAAEEAKRVKEAAEKAKREREKKERKAAEEAKRVEEAAEKAKREREEKERQAAAVAEAKKKRDDSNSPALVHSSLILLLLTVMGCTLVW